MNSEIDKISFGTSEPITFIHQLFEQQYAAVKDRMAIVFGDRSISYQELEERADLLSQVILTHSPRSAIVGISTTRSIETIIGVLAILKSGKAYLPLDPSYPEDRL